MERLFLGVNAMSFKEGKSELFHERTLATKNKKQTNRLLSNSHNPESGLIFGINVTDLCQRRTSNGRKYEMHISHGYFCLKKEKMIDVEMIN